MKSETARRSLSLHTDQDNIGLDTSDSDCHWCLTNMHSLTDLKHHIDKVRPEKRFIGSKRRRYRLMKDIRNRLQIMDIIINIATDCHPKSVLIDSGQRGFV